MMINTDDMKNVKKIVYVDLDGVVADYVDAASKGSYKVPNFFLNLPLMKGAKEAVTLLSEVYEVYFLSTAPWSVPSAWMEKRQWVENHFPEIGRKHLILSHNKSLLMGECLIDDRTVNGAGEFKGKHILFGGDDYPNWGVVLDELLDN